MLKDNIAIGTQLIINAIMQIHVRDFRMLLILMSNVEIKLKLA